MKNVILDEAYFKKYPNKFVVYLRVVGIIISKIKGFEGCPYTVEERILVKEMSTKEEREEAINKAGFFTWFFYLIEDRIGDKMCRTRLTIYNEKQYGKTGDICPVKG